MLIIFLSNIFLTYSLLSKNQWRKEVQFSISCLSKCLVSGFHVSSLCIMTKLWKKCQHESMKYQFIISKSCTKHSRAHFFLRLYMQLTTCIEPAAISNLNSIKVTGVSAAEQKIKTTVFFSSTLGFLVTSLVLHYRSTTNRCFNNFFFVENHIPRNSGICSMLTCIINKLKF